MPLPRSRVSGIGHEEPSLPGSPFAGLTAQEGEK